MGAVAYGCADASRTWYNKVREQKLAEGSKRSQFSPVRFTQKPGPGSAVIIGVATDDFLTTHTEDARAREAVTSSREATTDKWQMTHQDEPRDFIGVSIETKADGAVHLTQPDTMRKIEEHFFPDGDYPQRLTPLPPDYDQKEVSKGNDAKLAKEFQTSMGTIGYSRVTRLDCRAANSMLAESGKSADERDMAALIWNAAYLLTSRDVPLVYQAGPTDADIDKPMPWHAYSDASWATTATGHSRLGHCHYAGNREDHDKGVYSGAVIAKSQKEQGTLSDSASTAELKAMVQAVDTNKILRAMAQEMAGVADENTVVDEPPGSGPPSALRATVTAPALREVMESPPSELVGDNNSLSKRIQLEVTNKGKAMRKFSRLINLVKGAVEAQQIKPRLTSTKRMKANPLTKTHSSPTEHWRESEWLMGSSRELDAMKQLAKDGAHRGKAQKATSRGEATKGAASACSYEGDDEGEQSGDEGGDLVKQQQQQQTIRNTVSNGGVTERSHNCVRESRRRVKDAKTERVEKERKKDTEQSDEVVERRRRKAKPKRGRSETGKQKKWEWIAAQGGQMGPQ